ncbi:MAG TPA: hydrogenase maturation nickel metallochaperone HypA [Trueperaceae bacterium]|nr:hydrogenase maturation nickel metallochaperone HypA [Trueperaceae bacterium]
MHELGIARSIVDIAVETARRGSARRVTCVGLRVGALAGVEEDALDLAFEVARRGTPAESADLRVETVALRCHCASCDVDFDVDDRHGIALCPVCRKPSGDIRAGMELEVSYVEVM